VSKSADDAFFFAAGAQSIDEVDFKIACCLHEAFG